MTEREILDKLKEFEKEIFECSTKKQALDIKERLYRFVKENNVTPEQERFFTESGAGDMLHMMI